MEGSENNPVMFELMSELPWRAEKTTKEDWLKEYCYARYGGDDATIEKAWALLAQSIYNCPVGNNQQGTHESIFCGRPSLNNFQVSSWSKIAQRSTTRKIPDRLPSSCQCSRQIPWQNNYEYDLVDICRQALAHRDARNSTGRLSPTIVISPERSLTRMPTDS